MARRRTHHSTQTLLNRLIVACNDDARAQTAASLSVGNIECRSRLEDSASRRRVFASEVGDLVRALGGVPARGGSAFETVREAAHWFDALIIGDNDGDTYGSCARIEAKTEALYQRASHARLPAATKSLIARHLVEIASDRAELRHLSMGGTLTPPTLAAS